MKFCENENFHIFQCTTSKTSSYWEQNKPRRGYIILSTSPIPYVPSASPSSRNPFQKSWTHKFSEEKLTKFVEPGFHEYQTKWIHFWCKTLLKTSNFRFSHIRTHPSKNSSQYRILKKLKKWHFYIFYAFYTHLEIWSLCKNCHLEVLIRTTYDIFHILLIYLARGIYRGCFLDHFWSENPPIITPKNWILPLFFILQIFAVKC